MTRLVHLKQILILLIVLNFTAFTVCNSQDKRTIKVGLAQMKVVDGEIETNLKTAGEMIRWELTINTQTLKGTSLTNFINQKKQKVE